MRAGVVWANTFNKFDPSSPFGGYKESGFGREGGLHGLLPYVNLVNQLIAIIRAMEKTIKKSSLTISENGLEKKPSSKRLEVLKTYKIYIGGQFPRTESGRYYIPTNAAGKNWQMFA